MTKNPTTGLNESLDVELGLPLVEQKSGVSIDLRGQVRAVHRMPLQNGSVLYAYVDGRRSDHLVVVFTSRTRSCPQAGVPVWENLSRLRARGTALVVFEDPFTTAAGLPGWFLGSRSGDLKPELRHVIQKALGKSGAQRLTLAGHGAGGHGALRVFPEFPEARAVVVDTEVDPTRSRWPGAFRTFMNEAWAGDAVARVYEEESARFNVLDAFRQLPPRGHLLVLQDIRDRQGVSNNYLPLKDLYMLEQATGDDITGRKTFILDEPTLTSRSPFERLTSAIWPDDASEGPHEDQ